MCGLAGVIWKAGGADPARTQRHIEAFEPHFVHRGPNERGTFLGDGFGVVHRRLSIIDVAQGQQPMLLEDGRVGIVYNGEVYNHEILRRELEGKGHIFHTHCDTEVLLRLYLEDGPDSVDRLDGMFAFMIWDLRGSEPVYHLARDHLGIKPLYLYEDGNRVCFASEIRTLLAMPDVDLTPNVEGLQSYFTFRYTLAPHTIYDRITRLEAGSRMVVRHGRPLRIRYWDLPARPTPLRIGENEAQEQLHYLLRQSVSAQQMSEVPVGLLLSGGLDSSVIACLCGELGVRLKSFNIGFPDVNEFPYSNAVSRAFSLDHVTVETTVPEILARFDTVVEAMDEPIADPACFPLHILCDDIKKSVTVVLSGEGSDEMLAGYPQYLHLMGAAPTDVRDQLDAFLRHSWYFVDRPPPLVPRPAPIRALRQSSYFMERPLLAGMLAYDLKTWLPENLLMKADKIMMSHSLEGRFPFLSKAISEFIMSLPDDLKLRRGNGKRLLRKAFESQLPKKILERPKMGFSVPLDQLVLGLRPRAYELIDRLAGMGLATVVDMGEVRRRFDSHYAGQTQDALWVWTALVLLQWCSRPNRVLATDHLQ